jgi:hypothetical protein
MRVLAIMILCVCVQYEDYVIVMNETKKFIKITFELIIIRNIFLVIISSPIL